MVGLSTAWFLQNHSVDVTVLDQSGVAAGSSWGNAGWISPGLTIPLPEPSILRYGLRSLLSPNAPLYVPPTVDLGLWNFLIRFARHCTKRGWQQAMDTYVPLNKMALGAYDALSDEGVIPLPIDAPIMAAFRHAEQASELRHEFEMIERSGQHLETTELSGSDLRSVAPQLADDVELGIRIDGQRYINPGEFTSSLARSVEKRGGIIRSGWRATGIRSKGTQTIVKTKEGEEFVADWVVVATGAWLNSFDDTLGIRVPVQAGRGYSFSIATAEPVPFPIYFPAVRVACTPISDRLRVAGTMEFRPPDAPLDSKRVDAIIRSARPLLKGVDWDEQQDTWVGSRPVTSDGLPLIGASKMENVYVAGGHGMWGITLGPLTGQLLAAQIVTGELPEILRPLNPLR